MFLIGQTFIVQHRETKQDSHIKILPIQNSTFLI